MKRLFLLGILLSVFTYGFSQKFEVIIDATAQQSSYKLYFEIVSDTECEACGGENLGYSLVIPATAEYNGKTYNVVGIANKDQVYDGAFAQNQKIANVTLPSTMKYIGKNAFGECFRLNTINFPESLEEIGENAFHLVPLSKIILPDKVKEIKKNTFDDDPNLTEFVLSRDLEYIDPEAFGNLQKLVTITIPDGNKNFILEDGLLYDKDKTTLYLTPVTYKGEYVAPSTLKTIYKGAFSHCDGITTASLMNVEVLGKDAFNESKSLTLINFGNSLKTIEMGTCMLCDKLETAYMPTTMEEIKEGALDLCSLRNIYCYAYYPPAITGSTAFYPFSATVHVTNTDLYKEDVMWKRFGNIVTISMVSSPSDICEITEERYRQYYNINGIKTNSIEGITIVKENNKSYKYLYK